MVDINSNANWIGVLRTQGFSNSQNPYRCELSGLTAGAMAASVIIEKFNITKGAIKIGCDNDVSLQRVFDFGWNITASSAHYDLLRIKTHFYLRKSKDTIKWCPTKVQGHADEKRISPLTFMEYLYVGCDRRAKIKLTEILSSSSLEEYNPPLKYSGWKVTLQGRHIPDKEIYQFIQSPRTLQY